MSARNSSRHWLLAGLLCLGTASVGSAQEAPSDNPADAAKSQEQAAAKPPETSKPKPSKTDAPNKGTEGGFLPSEEISEDFAVSFPVDI